ncbi:V-type H+-transporting ATPase subunit H [Acrasis kona]|uniref:V-type proton ATPase subunit H n=1 Tax=Acrasis kona TaxID=1008807 RepID=A0AAW2Z9E9_9EUKA
MSTSPSYSYVNTRGYSDDNGYDDSNEKIPSVNWQPYQEMNVLTPLEKMRMDALNKTKDVEKITQTVIEVQLVWSMNAREYVELLIKLLYSIHQDVTLKYVLQLIDLLFDNSPKFLREFHQARNDNPYTPFLRLLTKTDVYMVEKCVKSLTALFSQDVEIHTQELGAFLEVITNQLEQGDKDERRAKMCVHALMVLLRKDECRTLFYTARGVPPLISLLKYYSGDAQMLYETIFCIWLLSFNKNSVEHVRGENLSAKIHEVLKTQQKEKVIRVSLSTIKNLIKNNIKFINDLINVSVPRTLLNLQKRNFEDKDILDDLKVLIDLMEVHIDEMSSFDEYRQEALSGHLEWSPVHTSEKFWKENLNKFEQNNFYILRELIKCLDSEVPQTKAIACHDLGQFVRYYPRGKKLIEDLGAKVKIIELMEYGNDEVRKHALLCTQKIMIQNWEMLNIGV